jgi:hypothetical protein
MTRYQNRTTSFAIDTVEGEMHILLGVFIGAPAFVFFVFACALGLNPVRGAAWGAIVGMAALAYVAWSESRPTVTAALPPCPAAAATPARPSIVNFDDLIPGCPGYVPPAR